MIKLLGAAVDAVAGKVLPYGFIFHVLYRLTVGTFAYVLMGRNGSRNTKGHPA